jgi:hypothetical protein
MSKGFGAILVASIGVALALGLALGASSLSAQGGTRLGLQNPVRLPAELLFHPSTVARDSMRLHMPRTAAIPDSTRPSNWRTGMLIGGGVGFLVGAALCDFPHDTGGCHTTAAQWLGSIFVLGLTGGLIGSLFH